MGGQASVCTSWQRFGDFRVRSGSRRSHGVKRRFPEADRGTALWKAAVEKLAVTNREVLYFLYCYHGEDFRDVYSEEYSGEVLCQKHLAG